jgi:hypothetical protein
LATSAACRLSPQQRNLPIGDIGTRTARIAPPGRPVAAPRRCRAPADASRTWNAQTLGHGHGAEMPSSSRARSSSWWLTGSNVGQCRPIDRGFGKDRWRTSVGDNLGREFGDNDPAGSPSKKCRDREGLGTLARHLDGSKVVAKRATPKP